MAKRYDNRGETPEGNAGFEDVSSYSSEKEYKKKKKNKRGKTVIKSIVGVLCTLIIILGAGMIYVSTNLVSELKTVAIDKDHTTLGIDIDNIVTDNSIKNIALFGLDSRTNAFEGHSDAIMILTIDNKNKKIKMTSILRDTKVDGIDGVGTDRINTAYAYGGAPLAIKTLNQNFHLDIQDYVAINFVQLTNVVNAFGGTVVEITDEEAVQINKNLTMLQYEGEEASASVRDYDYIDEVGGTYTLNGAQAVAYARIRYIDTDSQRTNRQKKVLMGLLERFKDMSVSEYPEMIRTVLGMCQTSLGFDDIFSMLPVVSGGYTQETLNIPGDFEKPWGGFDYNFGGAWVYVYDMERAAKHISTFIYEDLSPYYDPAMGNGADDWTQIMPSGFAKTYNQEDNYYFSYDPGTPPDDGTWTPEPGYEDHQNGNSSYPDDNNNSYDDDDWNSDSSGDDWSSGGGDTGGGDTGGGDTGDTGGGDTGGTGGGDGGDITFE